MIRLTAELRRRLTARVRHAVELLRTLWVLLKSYNVSLVDVCARSRADERRRLVGAQGVMLTLRYMRWTSLYKVDSLNKVLKMHYMGIPACHQTLSFS